MLAIASLATGFVVAAVTPSHALGDELSNHTVDPVSTLDKTITGGSLAKALKGPGKQKK